ncbi:MAG: response regulator [Nitrososphaera sp.]|nr:response regulator [Nitrososphaera sp.]
MKPSMTAMIVDDDSDILATVGKGLEEAGFSVHAFSDPIRAIQHVEDGCSECKVLVSDVRMPHMTGFQLIRRVKDLKPDMKVVLMTAFEVNMKEFESVFTSTTVDNVIRKPFPPSKLAEILKSIYQSESPRVDPQ